MTGRVQSPSRRRMSRNRDRGQAFTEFALVLPILLFLILGMADFARAWHSYQVITDAAREGARTAVVDNPATTEADVYAVVDSALVRSALDPTSATVAVTGFGDSQGTPAGVQIDYPFELRFVGRLFGWFTGDTSLTLSTHFVMRNE